MALSVGLHQKNTFCSFRRYSWGGDKLARVTTGWKGLKPLPKAPVIQYLFFLKEYAGLEDVVSDRFLASFLDMSPETLSRQKRCLREEKPD